jgi:hypothetical protein
VYVSIRGSCVWYATYFVLSIGGSDRRLSRSNTFTMCTAQVPWLEKRYVGFGMSRSGMCGEQPARCSGFDGKHVLVFAHRVTGRSHEDEVVCFNKSIGLAFIESPSTAATLIPGEYYILRCASL